MSGVLVSQSIHNKMQEDEWFKQENYFLVLSQAGYPRLSLVSPRLFPRLVGDGIPVFTWISSLCILGVTSSYQDISHTGFGIHLCDFINRFQNPMFKYTSYELHSAYELG